MSRLPASGKAALVLIQGALLLLVLATAPGRNGTTGDPPPGSTGPVQTCTSCHEAQASTFPDTLRFLEERARLSQAAWADTLDLPLRCGSCHLVPDPSELPQDRWPEAIEYMYKLQYYLEAVPAHTNYRAWAQSHRRAYLDLLHYFVTFSSEDSMLPPDPAISGMRFEPSTIGAPVAAGPPPRIGNVNVVDLDQDGRLDVLVGDFNRGAVTWLSRQDSLWQERPLAQVPFPGRTEVVDVNKDGVLDIAVAVLGTDVPSDERSGGVALLLGDGHMRFTGQTLLAGVGRVSDVRAGDFDGDGDVDFVVSIFGWIKEGEIGWLEQESDATFAYHRISDKAGGVNVVPVDLNQDGALDFVALIAQEHEEVTAFLNDGHGTFTPHVLFKAASPTFGSSGIELVDLDQDGDIDILYTNGDAVDLTSSMVRPYHGVQWLENRGDLTFVYHDLLRLYGAYRAVTGDFDGDGDLDIMATSLVNDWADPARMSLILLENDGQQQFKAHGIANAPTHLITADVGDLDGDGRLDLVTGSMHFEPPYDRPGRVTLFLSLQ